MWHVAAAGFKVDEPMNPRKREMEVGPSHKKRFGLV
jgi:hypothetical protein